MKKEKGPKNQPVCVGLDIGTRLIKLVEISYEGNVKKLTKLHSEEISSPFAAEDTKKALNTLLEKAKLTTTEVIISLSAPSAIVRFINMPKMKQEELKNALRFEAEKYIPFNINEVVIDALILEDAPEDSRQMRVLLAAAKKNVVDSRLAMLKDVGLSTVVIDVDSFACFNAFCNSFDNLDKSKSTVLLNMGYTQTNVLISRGDSPFFTRDIQIGAKDIERHIAKEMDLEENQASALLLNPKDKAEAVFENSKPVLNTLIDELRLSFGYYENQYGKNVNEIYISGGTMRLGGILDYLSEHIGIKPLIWDPFSKCEKSPKIDTNSLESTRSQFAVCAGLAIRK